VEPDRLRTLVDGPDRRMIMADRENVALNPDGARGRHPVAAHAVRSGTDAMSTDALRRAAEALDGDFLEGLDLPDCQEFHSWCTAEREEARRLRAQILGALITRLADAPTEALRYARALSLLEPADEAAQATLVRLLRATGRWREAEEQYQRAQQRLDEFNVVRTGTLRQAAQQALQGDAHARRG